ncbi:MAG: 3'-5' exonuclease [Paucibacter sp.]|nr:3'-5' exonuclease [Roseateles sp.]
MQTIAVIDFETTGMTGSGGRATEIAAVLVRNGEVVGQYQSLMQTGMQIPPFIERLTGISNRMLEDAPPAEEVMKEVAEFTKGVPLVAHNASFDRSFWQTELALAGVQADPSHEFVCTVLLARRIYPEAPNCKLGTLAAFFELPQAGRAHRALADATVTAHLLLRMQRDLERRYANELGDCPVDHALLSRLQRAPLKALGAHVRAYAREWHRVRQLSLC